MRRDPLIRIIIIAAAITLSTLYGIQLSAINRTLQNMRQVNFKLNEIAYFKDEEYSIKTGEVGLKVVSTKRISPKALLAPGNDKEYETLKKYFQYFIDNGSILSVISVKITNNTKRIIEVPCYKFKLTGENWSAFIDQNAYSIMNKKGGNTLTIAPKSEVVDIFPYIIPPDLISSTKIHYNSSKASLWLVLELFPVKTTISLNPKALLGGTE